MLSSSMEGGRKLSGKSSSNREKLNSSLTGTEGPAEMSAEAVKVHELAKGLAAVDGVTQRELGNVTFEMTGTVGSLLYMAPEVYSGGWGCWTRRLLSWLLSWMVGGIEGLIILPNAQPETLLLVCSRRMFAAPFPIAIISVQE